MQKEISPQKIWRKYEAGVDFKNSIGLYEAVDKNERFFAGDQWVGVNAPDLPKPVINFIKRACQQRVAEVSSNPIGVEFDSVEFPEFVSQSDIALKSMPDEGRQMLNALFDADWNRLNMDAVNLDGLLDAAVTGDLILYNYWDCMAETGQAADGQICVQLIDSVNLYPGNPNDRNIQNQPDIIIARRELVSDVIVQAKANGRPKAEISLIASDHNMEYMGGDMGKRELSDDENAKCVTLLYLFKDERGHVMAQKAVNSAVIRPLWDTRLTRYPISVMNWEIRKNCFHGRAEVTGLIPVQRYINQMYAMSMLFTMQSACPKAVFNQGMVKGWSNAVGTAIPVNGDIGAAIKYLDPPKLPPDVYKLPEQLMNTTLRLIGVTDIELGNVNPSNTSALVMAREAATMPVQSVKERFYAMIEDFARNWLDMIFAYSTVPRWMKVLDKDGEKNVVFDASSLRDRLWSVKIDVGAANAWSGINSVDTLNRLFGAGVIDARQYVERLPDGYLPMREKLLSELAVKDGAQSGMN
ncbi:MAG TPA: hypothetical protein VHO66_05490 [Ruminiclostridium sp.]|nr:hypothetical protein [Ruminiclostridium sp.]